MASVYRVWNEFISYYSIVLAVVGTICNFITFFLCLRKQLRKVPTFVFLAFMSLADALSLCYWNLNDYFLTFYNRTMSDFGEIPCKLTTFLQIFFSQSSSYLLVALTLERYLSVRIKNWRSVKFDTKKSLILSLGIIAFFFILNFHLNITLTFQPVANHTLSGVCQSTKMYKDWRIVHTYLYSMIPFFILFVINALLMYEVLINNKNRISSDCNTRKNKSMSISVIGFTVAFLILTGPFALAGGYYFGTMITTELGRVILYSFVALAFTYHGSNLFILLCLNKKFLDEFKILLRTDFSVLRLNTSQKPNESSRRT